MSGGGGGETRFEWTESWISSMDAWWVDGPAVAAHSRTYVLTLPFLLIFW